MPAQSSLRHALADPATRLRATFVLVPRVEVVESLCQAGFEAVVIDLEHGPITVADLPPLVAAGQGAGMFVLVRVPEGLPSLIGAVLDLAVDGVVVPHVSSASQAEEIVRSARFPPTGERSINPYVRAARYQGTDGWTARADAGTAVLVMVEGAEAASALGAIAAVPGVDAVFVGPIDLSAALGRAGDPEHPDVVNEVGRIIAEADAAGVATAVYCPNPAAARRWQRIGARLVVLSADLAMAYDGFTRYLRGIDEDRGRL